MRRLPMLATRMPSLHLPSQLLVPVVDTDHLIPSNFPTPFYYTARPRWYSHTSDKTLALLAPIIAHWCIILLHRMFLFVHCPNGNHHTFSRRTVRIIAEIQIVQTLFGWVWLTRFGNKEGPRDPAREMQAVGRLFGAILPSLMGKESAQEFLNQTGEELIQFTYWWAIPVARQFLAKFTLDAWQAFLRFLDIDHYLYPDVHAFLFDTIGVCLAYSHSGVTHREITLLLVFSSLRTLGPCPRGTVLSSTVPRPSLQPSISPDKKATVKPGEHGPFIGFPQKLRRLAQCTVLAVEARFMESRRIQRALQATPPPQASSQDRTRPQLRLDISAATN